MTTTATNPNQDTSRLIGTTAIVACLILAPALEVFESILSPLVGTSTSADLTAIGDHRGAFITSVLIGLLATALYIPAFLGLASSCLARSPRLARIGGVMAVVSMLGFCGVRMMQAVQLQLADDAWPTKQAAKLVDHAGTNPIGAVMLVMFLGGTVIGSLALAAAAWRNAYPKAAVILLLVFPFVDLGLPGHVGTIASHSVMLVALTWLAMSLQARRDLTL